MFNRFQKGNSGKTAKDSPETQSASEGMVYFSRRPILSNVRPTPETQTETGRFQGLLNRIRSAASRELIYLMLIFATVNATFRITESGMTSAYRLLAPFLFASVMLSHWKWFKKDLLWMGVAAVYGVAVSLMFYRHIAFDMWVFLGYLFVLYIFVMTLYRSERDFTCTFFRFLHILTNVTLILCWIQFFVRVPYKFLELAREPGVNVFMSNENELAAPLACMLMIYLYRIFFKKEWRYCIQAANIAFFIFINDAKLSMLGLCLGVGVYCVYGLYMLLRRKWGISGKVLILGLVAIAAILVTLFFVIDPEIQFRDYKISIKKLVLDGVLDIVLLRPTYGSGGSIVDRTNAIIFGLMELRNTSFFGIGWGNSITMLEMPQYQLMTAKSMHNIIAQFLTEFGFFAIVCYILIGIWLFKTVKNAEKHSINIMKVAFAAAFVLISSQSSVGVLSNYYMWMVVFYIVLSYRYQEENRMTVMDPYERETVGQWLRNLRGSCKLIKGIFFITVDGILRIGTSVKRYLAAEREKES